MKINQFVMYGCIIAAVAAAGTGLINYTSSNVSVESITVDDTEYDALYSTKSDAAEIIDGKININSADAKTLQSLKGIGPVTAEKIIEYRELNGVFRSAEEIMDVPDVGQKTYEVIKESICAQ